LPRPFLARDHERGRAVVDPARVPGGDAAALAERGLQRGELLLARLGPRVLVALRLADGDELVFEASRRVRVGPAPLRPQREPVLLLARDAVALGDVLAGLAHRLERVHRLQPRVRATPAEGRVPNGSL